MNTKSALIIAAAIIVSSIVLAYAANLAPNAVNGCVYYSSAPTLSNGQRTPFHCDSSGNLKVN